MDLEARSHALVRTAGDWLDARRWLGSPSITRDPNAGLLFSHLDFFPFSCPPWAPSASSVPYVHSAGHCQHCICGLLLSLQVQKSYGSIRISKNRSFGVRVKIRDPTDAHKGCGIRSVKKPLQLWTDDEGHCCCSVTVGWCGSDYCNFLPALSSRFSYFLNIWFSKVNWRGPLHGKCSSYHENLISVVFGAFPAQWQITFLKCGGKEAVISDQRSMQRRFTLWIGSSPALIVFCWSAPHQHVTCIWIRNRVHSCRRTTVASGWDGEGRPEVLIKVFVPLVTSHVFA